MFSVLPVADPTPLSPIISLPMWVNLLCAGLFGENMKKYIFAFSNICIYLGDTGH